MDLTNTGVKHRIYGTGIIIEHQNNSITVNFEDRTTKFQFPSCFENFLIAEDPAIAAEIGEMIQSTRARKQRSQDAIRLAQAEKAHAEEVKTAAAQKRARIAAKIKKHDGNADWIIPCDASAYDVYKAFKSLAQLRWPQEADMTVGDIVYIYIGEPIQAVSFKCRVEAVDLPSLTEADKPFILNAGKFACDRYMALAHLNETVGFEYAYKTLRGNGLGTTIRGPIVASKELSAYLDRLIYPRGAILRSEITEDTVALRIDGNYRPDMTDEELYETTRGAWRQMMPAVDSVRCALAVFRNEVVNVYRVSAWFTAGTFPMRTRILTDEQRNGCVEFIGEPADDPVRSRFIGRDASPLFSYSGNDVITIVKPAKR